MKQFSSALEIVRMVIAVIRAYRMAGPNGMGYCAVEWRGVPRLTCLVARDREAWRVSQLAIEAYPENRSKL